MRIWILFLLLIPKIFFAQKNIHVTVDNKKINIGQPITYSIKVSDTHSIQFPELKLHVLELTKEFDIIQQRKSSVKKYQITGFHKGKFYIPSQKILIDGKLFYTDSIQIKVSSPKVNLQKQPLYGLKPNESQNFTFQDFIYYFSKYNIGYFILAFTPFAIYLVNGHYQKRKLRPKKQKKIVKKPYITAKKALLALENQKLKDKDFYSELSKILRSYLSNKLHIKAQETVTDELTTLLKEINSTQRLGLETSFFNDLISVLKNADTVKFAKTKLPDDTLKKDVIKTKKLIEIINKQNKSNA